MSSPDPYLRYVGLGVEILAAMVICASAGYAADRLAGNQTPWFLLSGCIVGIAYVITAIIRKTKA